MDDFEDAVQFYSAIRVNPDYLITRNADDFPKNDIPIISPDELLATLATAELGSKAEMGKAESRN